MKKFLKVFMIMVLVAFPFVTVNAKTTKKAEKEPINFYIFYGSSCGFCQKLHNYTATLEKDKTINSKFRIVDYEVWGDKDNNALMTKVGSYFNFDVDGVPFYVIGDQYFTGFSEETSPEKIVNAINKEYADSNYVDVVAGIQNGTIQVDESKTLSNEKEASKKNDVVGYIILGITAAIVIAILFGRSSTNVSTEVSEIEVQDTKTEEKKEKEEKKDVKAKTTSKKTNNKKSSKK